MGIGRKEKRGWERSGERVRRRHGWVSEEKRGVGGEEMGGRGPWDGSRET
jgi:hypothetical protein